MNVDMISQLEATFGGLVGFAAFVAAVVNVLKYFGVVADGDAPKVAAGLNLIGLIGLFLLEVFLPGTSIDAIDAQFGAVAVLVALLLSFVVQMGVSKLTHIAIKGVPLIGFSHNTP